MIAEDLLRPAVRRLAAARIEAPQREARLLLAHAAGLEAATLVGWPETPIDEGAADRFSEALTRRLGREPLSRILGHREFWSLDLLVTPETLDPRPETEHLVEAALARLPAHGAQHVVDLGTGTGCILLALVAERVDAWGLGIDRSAGAVRTAARNARRLGLDARARFLVGDWAAAIAGPVDLIVSNPPYIATASIAGLDLEVRDHDPPAALDGGADGLDAYRAIARSTRRVLAASGVIAVEIGAGQAETVSEIFAQSGFAAVDMRRDLASIVRVLVFQRK